MSPAFAPLVGGGIGTLIYYRWRHFWPQFFDGLVRSLLGRPPRSLALAAQRFNDLQQEDPAERRSRAVRDAYLRDEFGPDELDWRILLALKPPMPSEREWRRHERRYAAALAAQWRTDGSGADVPLVLTSSITATAHVPEAVTIPWTAAERSPRLPRMMAEGENCSFRELHSGSGYIATVCDCGHDINQHYNGGCNDCDAMSRMAGPPPPPHPDVREPLPGQIAVQDRQHLPPDDGGVKPTLPPSKPSDARRSVTAASEHGVTMPARIIVEKHWQ